EDPAFGGLAFCLLGVASPSDLIRDTRLTLFNIGKRIELTDFTDAEADLLRIGLEVGDLGTPGRPEKEARALVKRVLYWTGGDPYLTQRLCQALATAPSPRPSPQPGGGGVARRGGGVVDEGVHGLFAYGSGHE